MLTKILKENRIFVSILLLIVWTILLFSDSITSTPSLQILPQLLILTSLGMIAAWQNARTEFWNQQHFFLFFFLLLHLFWIQNWTDLSFFAGYLFIQFTLMQLLSENYEYNALINPFDIGFFASIAMIFYPPFWIFLIYFLLFFILSGHIQIRYLLLYLLGVVTTALISAQLVWLTDSFAVWEHFKTGIVPSVISFQSTLWWNIPLLLIGIYAFIDYFSHINTHSEEKKHIFFHAIVLLIFGLLFIILYGAQNNHLWLLILPLSFYLAHLTSRIHWIRAEILLWVLLFTILLYHTHSYIPVPDFFRRVTF